MKAQLRQFWISRTPRYRGVLVALAAVVGVTLYLWFAYSLDHARSKLRSTVTSLRAQAVRLDQQAAEIARLRAAPPVVATQTDLRTLLQSQLSASGLARDLGRIDALDPNRATVVFGAVSFSNWLAWVASVQPHHVRLEACRIEALSQPGLVSVTATFARAQ